MYAITVQLTIKRECIADFMRELAALRVQIQREQDCLGFDVLHNIDCPETVLLVETWTSREYFEQVQLKRPYYAPYLARVQPMWAEERRLQHWRIVN